ncbi:MAG: hypothetical protein Q8861_06910 [Bacteroidota bacterium]|nr:hypothetical protein [Bacteroidota bacterium]
MKGIIGFVICIFFLGSCTITEYTTRKCDCSHYAMLTDEIACSGIFGKSDTCLNYFNVWKQLFLSRNNMTEDYFNAHIFPCSTGLGKWDDGISFNISYKVKIDWVEARLYDSFPVFLNSSTAGWYPSIAVPRTTLLSKDQINSLIDASAFSAQMFTVASVNTLKYTSRQAAFKVLIKAAKTDTLCTSSILYKNTSRVNPTNGHPYLEASGDINWDKNQCITGLIDLVTGETTITPGNCYILFCFDGNTQIALPDGTTKCINTIKKGDKVLTVNMKTMKPETDIVQKIDSVTHDDIVKIAFSDNTININTADHPYFVKGKGWCSCKPALTRKKYNISTQQLTKGDICLKYTRNQLTEIRVESITPRSGSIMTYNLSRLLKNNNYLANGIVVSTEK